MPPSRDSGAFTSTKGLLNGPGQNNCFLNSAVQEAAADPDAAARAVVAGRSRVVTILMNVVKCTQKASSDINKMLMDILADLAACAKKPDAFEVVKCMMSDAGLKKLSAAVLKTLEVVKCSLD